MIIGLDFDNTIVTYDHIFHRAAVESYGMPATISVSKHAVREWFRGQREGRQRWIELQGIVYGTRMSEARLSHGLDEFLARCHASRQTVIIISHKTRHPASGLQVDLHEAAWRWLEDQRFFASDGFTLSRQDVFFELRRSDKLRRISRQKCNVYVDDLPEVLEAPKFPAGIERILYDPCDMHPNVRSITRCESWAEIARQLFA